MDLKWPFLLTWQECPLHIDPRVGVVIEPTRQLPDGEQQNEKSLLNEQWPSPVYYIPFITDTHTRMHACTYHREMHNA